MTAQASTDRHDYRECFYDSQPDRASIAAQDCPRFPCRVFREGAELGYQLGYQRGYDRGYADGYGAGYSAGFADGLASCPGPHGGGLSD